MTHSMTDAQLAKANEEANSFEIDGPDDPYRGLRAKPEDRIWINQGMLVEDFFGICADEFDDEYMEAVLSLRRGKCPQERQS